MLGSILKVKKSYKPRALSSTTWIFKEKFTFESNKKMSYSKN